MQHGRIKKNARLKNSMDFINSYNESDDINQAVQEVAALSNTGKHSERKIRFKRNT